MQNPPVVMQILLVAFIICISTKLGKKPTRGKVVRVAKREEKGREAVKEENGEKSLVEDSSPPPANAKWYWNEKAGRKGGTWGGEREERSFPLAFSRRKSWLVVVSK